VPSEWLWLGLDSLKTQAMALALLRQSETIHGIKALKSMMEPRRGAMSDGTLYNMMRRLTQQGTIRFERGRMTLLDQAKAPQIWGKHAWGPAEIFTRQEIAIYRRNLILALLKINPGGLSATEITGTIQTLAQNIPHTRDAVRDDMATLSSAEQVAMREDGSKLWVLAVPELEDEAEKPD